MSLHCSLLFLRQSVSVRVRVRVVMNFMIQINWRQQSLFTIEPFICFTFRKQLKCHVVLVFVNDKRIRWFCHTNQAEYTDTKVAHKLLTYLAADDLYEDEERKCCGSRLPLEFEANWRTFEHASRVTRANCKQKHATKAVLQYIGTSRYPTLLPVPIPVPLSIHSTLIRATRLLAT